MAFKEFTPEEWLAEIENGLDYRRRFGLEDMWGQLEAIYYNVHESRMNDGPNILLSQGDAMLSMITVPSPRISVKPVKPEEVDKAPIVETIDNVLMREINLAAEVESCALNAYLFGRGFLKIGYDSEWGYDPSLDMGGSLQLGMTLTQLNKSGSRRIEYDSAVAPGSPWVRSVLPHDIVVPWGTKEISTTPWIAHRIVRHIDDLRADLKYENTKRLQPQISMEDFVDSYKAPQKMLRRLSNGEPKYVELFEIHDRRTGKIYVVTHGHDAFLRNEYNSLQIDNQLPFAALGFTPRTRSFWTTPDAYYLYHVQNELSDVAIQRTKQRRIATLKFLYDSDSISEEELMKVLSTDVGVAAKIEGGRDIQKAILKLENTPNLLLAQEEELLRANGREQIGFSRNQLGEYSGGRKTATEVSAVDQSSKLRMSRRGLQVKRLYEDTMRLVNGMVFSFWTLPRYFNLLGGANAQKWVQINGPSLRGRYDYQVDFIEEGQEKAMKLEALNLYQLLAQDPAIDPVGLRSYLVNQINDPEFERLFNADVRSAMQQMSLSGGSIQPQGAGGQRAGILQQLRGQSNTDAQSLPVSVLAR